MKRWRELSLRPRLTLLYVVLLTLLLGALGGALYFDTRQFLVTNTATRMRAQARPIIESYRPPQPPSNGPAAGRPSPPAPDLPKVATALAGSLTSRDTTAVILDSSGAVLANGHDSIDSPASVKPDPEQVASALAGAKDVTYVAEADGQRQLVALVPLRLGGDTATLDGLAQLNSPLELADAILSRQRTLTVGGVLFALLAGGLGVLWLTGSTLAPLRAMVATCRGIAAGDFAQRVRLPQRRDEIGQLAVAFDEMAERIEATFAAQNRFVADAAHELRTPMTALRGSLEVLLRGSQDDPAAANLLLQGMYREVARLGRLTEQLLDLTRLDAPLTAHRQPIDLNVFFADFMIQARTLAADRTVTLIPGPAVNLSADPDLLNQTLYNLVDNAAQHTADGGTIRLGWSLDADSVTITVADDGEGIPPDDLPHLFEPFYRGDRSRSRRRGGTGLGLAVVRAIAEAHGGTISASGSPGAGATFALRLPLKTEKA